MLKLKESLEALGLITEIIEDKVFRVINQDYPVNLDDIKDLMTDCIIIASMDVVHKRNKDGSYSMHSSVYYIIADYDDSIGTYYKDYVDSYVGSSLYTYKNCSTGNTDYIDTLYSEEER